MRRPRAPLLTLCLLACADSSTSLRAESPARHAPSQPAAIARLRLEATDGGYLAWADNLLAGPIEVRLEAGDGDTPPSQPALPARAGVPAGGSTLVARLPTPTGSTSNLSLHLRGVPGSTNARPRDVPYLPPLAAPTLQVDQGFDGGFSHLDDENRYALDFATPVGTPVLAARAGIVMQVQDRFSGNGQDYGRDAGRANFIRILHDDGSMALYAHLATGGALVRIGSAVTAGQRIGLSGNTGYSSAPHLHFAVQVNRSLRLCSIRFRMPGLRQPGPMAVPQTPAASSEGSTSSRHCGSLSSMPTARR